MGSSETAILERVILPEIGDLPPEAAHFLLAIDFGKADRQRMDELAAKARQGTLSAEEETEVESYRHVGHLLALMQSKARRSLGRGKSPIPS